MAVVASAGVPAGTGVGAEADERRYGDRVGGEMRSGR